MSIGKHQVPECMRGDRMGNMCASSHAPQGMAQGEVEEAQQALS